MQIHQLRDVFSPGGLPSITYVGRDHLQLEQRIQRAVDRGFAFNVVTGPTKSGKSVLCHRVLDATKLVTMEGGQISNIDDFWQQLAHRLEIAAGLTKTKKEGESFSGEVNAGWNLGTLLTLKSKAEISSGRDSSRQYVTALKIACMDTLCENKAILLIDDFHYLDGSTQKSVI